MTIGPVTNPRKLSQKEFVRQKGKLRDKIKGMNSQLRIFDNSFSTLKNFNNKSWIKMTNDLARHGKFKEMIENDKKDFKNRATRLRLLLVPLKQRVERIAAEKAAARKSHVKSLVTRINPAQLHP